MLHNDERTILEGQTAGVSPKGCTVQEKQANPKAWKHVMVGGITAIAVGATVAYAVGENGGMEDLPHDDQYNENTSNQNAEQAERADAGWCDHLSFADAFDEARELVGAGGVFTWHNQLYNTYTESEWSALSEEEKDAFIEALKEDANTAPEPYKVIVPETSLELDPITEPEQTPAPMPDQHPPIELEVVHEEVSLPSGGTIFTGSVEGHQASVIDIDPHLNDGGDIAIIDLNDNLTPDANEVFDVHTGEQQDEAVGAQILAALQEDVVGISDVVPTSDVDVQDVVHNSITGDVAPDMPDYMNDADVSFA